MSHTIAQPGTIHGARSRLLAGLLTAATLAASTVQAQVTARTTQVTPGAGTEFVVGGDWLQANALPMDRVAMHSGAAAVGVRWSGWTFDAGWLRVARDLSTVQGGTLSAGRLLRLGPVSFVPSVSGLVGRADASVDSTGYDWVAADGSRGHQTRYSYSRAVTSGAGASLAIEVPVYGPLAFHGTVSQWYFGGAPLEGDRMRTLAGAGLTLHVGR